MLIIRNFHIPGSIATPSSAYLPLCQRQLGEPQPQTLAQCCPFCFRATLHYITATLAPTSHYLVLSGVCGDTVAGQRRSFRRRLHTTCVRRFEIKTLAAATYYFKVLPSLQLIPRVSTECILGSAARDFGIRMQGEHVKRFKNFRIAAHRDEPNIGFDITGA